MNPTAGKDETDKARSWPDGSLKSPQTGRSLYRDRAFLTDEYGSERWPVVEEIPYLRTDRERLREKVCGLLDHGEDEAALVELLRDQDDWAPAPPPDRNEVARAVGTADDAGTSGSGGSGGFVREVMQGLGFDAVADYFSYRLSDPTYLAGLALIQEHWNEPRTSFEMACGVGHYTRELARRGVRASAGDVVFAKLWLARRFLVPEARLVCFDASRGFPVPDASADLVLCQDAFYFLPDKPHVARELYRISGPEGTILVGHSHNADTENLSAGDPVSVNRHADLFPDSALYDDEDLTQALIHEREPRIRDARGLSRSEAVCLARPGLRREEVAPSSGPDLLLPPEGTSLYPNPLYERDSAGDGEFRELLRLRWPSSRYEEEYARRSFYLPAEVEVGGGVLSLASSRGAGASPEVDRLARMKVLVELVDPPARVRV